MIRRHSEFVLLYNAECDAPNPKSMARLRAELRAMERTWSQKSAASLLAFDDEDDLEASIAKYRRSRPVVAPAA